MVEILVTGHGFLDSAQRDDFNDIQHAYIEAYHYGDSGWSDDFYGLGVMVLSKNSYRKIRDPLITFDGHVMERGCKRVQDSARGDLSVSYIGFHECE